MCDQMKNEKTKSIDSYVSSMTVFAEANVDVDLRMLRSFRVLRPLKLVSRIPSKRWPFPNT